MNYKVSLVFIFTFCNCSAWTWTYKKDFALDKRDQFTYFVKQTECFNQLIFSWNILRPLKGYFKFYVSVRTTSGWSRWFNAADWGFGVQRSYLDKDSDIGFYHVRLEVFKAKADAFRLKIEAVDGADLSLLKSVAVTVSDKALIKAETYNELRNLPNVFIKNVPAQSQMALKHEDNGRICSPTSISMLLGYFKRKKINPLITAQSSFDDGLQAYGSWPFNIAHAFESYSNCRFSVVRLASFKNLHSYLQRGVPVVVSIRGNLKGAAKDYPHGHLILVNGWNKDKKLVYVHDPAFKRDSLVRHSYRVEDFLKAWERSHRLAYVVDC
jgi:hypothetical protein